MQNTNSQIAIFPIERATAPIARYSKDLLNSTPICLLPSSLRDMEGKDLSVLDGGGAANILLHLTYEDEIKMCDTIYFHDSRTIEDNGLYKSLIEYARGLNKKIIIGKCLCEKLGLVYEGDYKQRNIQIKGSLLVQPDVPIISIFSEGVCCDQFSVELAARRYFVNQGYKVSQIGTESSCELFGFTPVPEFITDSQMDVEKKMIMFNQYVNDIIQEEEPDLFIMGIPNPIMKYDNRILNGMGVTPYVMGNAVTSDIAIGSCYFNLHKKEYFEELKKYCTYRFSSTPEYFNIANTQIISDNAYFDRKLQYLLVDHEFVAENIDMNMGGHSFTLFNTFDAQSQEKVFEKIEGELAANVACI